MYRSIMDDLLKWKDSSARKPLVITGVRQCGKTYVMQDFGKKHFDSVVYVNLEKNELAASVFDYDYDVKRIVAELETIIAAGKIIMGETLLILDEIQACPRAITSLKYFCEDMRELHVICAGSLLGVALKHQNISFPVGKISRLRMFPMSFYEFLVAVDEKSAKLLKGFADNRPLPSAYMEQMGKHYRNYLFIGGMPEVVEKWCKNHDYAEIEELQNEILDDYAADFSKYAPLSEVPKLHWIWESVPKQLAKDNNKFMFSQVKAGKRAHELENALQWLVDAGLVHRCELVANPQVPLSFSADARYFKVYMEDIGLLCRRSGLSYKSVLSDDGMFASFKGAMAENYVFNELLHSGYKSYFWRSGNTAELDFLMEIDGQVVPIEVKSADNTRAKSYRRFCQQYNMRKGFKFSLKNIGINMIEETETINLPLYMIWKMKTYTEYS